MTAEKRYPCGRCGARRRVSTMIYSRFTRNRYCGPRDLAACDRRAARQQKEGK